MLPQFDQSREAIKEPTPNNDFDDSSQDEKRYDYLIQALVQDDVGMMRKIDYTLEELCKMRF